MRRIDKGMPIPSFVDFVRGHPHADWDDSFGIRHLWRKHMLENEQHYLSGYTEIPVRMESSHIDHFRKRDWFHTLTYDWANLVVDSMDETFVARYKDNFIKNKGDNEKLINPVREDAARFFKYELTGKITAADNLNDIDKERAFFTIDAFNLNEGSLKDRRKRIMTINLDSYADFSDEMIYEALGKEGFRSVVEQLLQERIMKIADDDQKT